LERIARPEERGRPSYSGANADIIESQITEPLEKSINGIAGIKNISAGLAPSKTIGDGVKATQEIAASLLDDTFTTSLGGSSRDFAESSGNTASLPLALSIGAASSSRTPLGLVIVGGVIFSLILTLFVIPAMYSYLSRKNVPTNVHEVPAPPKELVYES
jgi:multidrug efflux pump subunit AcrB